jgi:hypothetical protein
MLTRRIHRTETVSEGAIEYEYRDADYEYEEMPEPRKPSGAPVGERFMGNHTRRPR